MTTDIDVHIYAVGSFGASVADVLRLYVPGLVATYGAKIKDVLDGPGPSDAVQVLAIAEPSESDCADFTRFCYANSCRFVPLTLQPGSLWLGPVTGPHLGPCWSCAMRRCKQHLRLGGTSLDHKQLELPETVNIPGRLLPLVASAIWHLLHVSRVKPLPRGFLWRMDLTNQQITAQTVVTIHRCDFCSLIPKGFDASARQMREALSYLYSASPESESGL